MLAKSISKNCFTNELYCVSSHFVCLFFIDCAPIGVTVYTHSLYSCTIKKGVWPFEMDCEWNFKSQTMNNFIAESNNQNEFFSLHTNKAYGKYGHYNFIFTKRIIRKLV